MKYSQAIELAKNGSIKRDIWKWTWEVTDQFVWYLNYEDKKEYVIVPKGFKTDFGSIPRLLWFIFEPTKYIWYILHDYLVSWEWKVQNSNDYSFYICKRKQADRILIESINIEGATIIGKILIYIGVRIGAFLRIGWR